MPDGPLQLFQLSNFGKIYKQLNFEAHSLMTSFWSEEYVFAQEELCQDIKTHTKTTGISGCEIERVSSSSQSGLQLFFTTRLFTFCKNVHFIKHRITSIITIWKPDSLIKSTSNLVLNYNDVICTDWFPNKQILIQNLKARYKNQLNWVERHICYCARVL